MTMFSCPCGEYQYVEDRSGCRKCKRPFGFRYVSLPTVAGMRVVDARAEWIDGGNSRHNAVRIDGTWYEFREDPDDGYRSSCDLAMLDSLDAPAGSVIEFPPMTLSFIATSGGSEEMLRAIDERTGLCILEGGTDGSDDYYPSYTFRWDPDGWTPPQLEARHE